MIQASLIEKEPSSFRDPSGFVFWDKGTLYRQVNLSYQKNYQLLFDSGLYAELTEKGLLIPHKEVDRSTAWPEMKYKVIQPEAVPFISYPYEWSFSQLKDAALLTLELQKRALKRGLSLKDASAYNIQFIGYKPVFIDTLSFEAYQENKPWVAYRQFCQHFLAPLALMAKLDLRLGTLLQTNLDGVPLDLASRLLPGRTKYSLGLAAHLHLHARSQVRHADAPSTSRAYNLSLTRLMGLLDNLEATVKSLRLPKQKTVWQDYYENTNYSERALSEKENIVQKWIEQVKPARLWDAGGNDGTFASLASAQGIYAVSSDIDPLAIEFAYQKCKQKKEAHLLPLILDLTNPSPAIGWQNRERESFHKRGSFDLTLCLAFIHHLAIANNLPLAKIAELFHQQTKSLIIEFVPKEDSNTQRLLAAREDIFPFYTQADFEKEFSRFFQIKAQAAVKESHRRIYLMERK